MSKFGREWGPLYRMGSIVPHWQIGDFTPKSNFYMQKQMGQNVDVLVHMMAARHVLVVLYLLLRGSMH